MSRNHLYQQHYLKSPRLVAELIGHTNIRKNDTVYDLGAGSGVISVVLARRCKEVVAVENEKKALLSLSNNLKKYENTRIIAKDLLNLKIPTQPYKIFANIPFGVSSEVVEKFCFSQNPPKSLNLIVQKQFALKLVESDRHFNSALGAMLWPWFSVRIRKPLKKSDFTPPPSVDTVLLEIKPLTEPALPTREIFRYTSFVVNSFQSQKFFGSLSLSKAGIKEEKKPSELSSGEWIRLFKRAAKIDY